MSDLAWYLYNNNPLPCIAGKYQNLDNQIYSHNSEIEAIDISILWPDHKWTEIFHRYFLTGEMISMDRQFCEEIKMARRQWFKRLSIPGYRDLSKG